MTRRSSPSPWPGRSKAPSGADHPTLTRARIASPGDGRGASVEGVDVSSAGQKMNARGRRLARRAAAWLALTLPLGVHATVSVWLLGDSYYSYFLDPERGESPTPDYAARAWLFASAAVWLGAAVLLLVARSHRQYAILWLTPPAWLAATWLTWKLTTFWIVDWISY